MISSTAVDLIVTMGSYRTFVHFLNSFQTCMKSFFCIVQEWVNATQKVCATKRPVLLSDKSKILNLMMKTNI